MHESVNNKYLIVRKKTLAKDAQEMFLQLNMK